MWRPSRFLSRGCPPRAVSTLVDHDARARNHLFREMPERVDMLLALQEVLELDLQCRRVVLLFHHSRVREHPLVPHRIDVGLEMFLFSGSGRRGGRRG